MEDSGIEKHYTIYDIADQLKVSRQTVTRMFQDEPGVLILGTEETRYGKPHRTLRIPESVAHRVLESKKQRRIR